MKNNNQLSLQYIARTDVNKVLFNKVFAYAQTKAKTQPTRGMRWRDCRSKSAENICLI